VTELNDERQHERARAGTHHHGAIRGAQGLKRNIRLQRIGEIIDKFEALLRGYVPGVLPWVESMEVSATWDYRQFEQHRRSTLPSTTTEDTVNP
jgi:hypothetical protein